MQVMYARQHERQAMKDALEMALLTSVSHPFIIHVSNNHLLSAWIKMSTCSPHGSPVSFTNACLKFKIFNLVAKVTIAIPQISPPHLQVKEISLIQNLLSLMPRI